MAGGISLLEMRFDGVPFGRWQFHHVPWMRRSYASCGGLGDSFVLARPLFVVISRLRPITRQAQPPNCISHTRQGCLVSTLDAA